MRHEDWIKELKIGDTVIVQCGYNSLPNIGTVTKRTNTGQFVVTTTNKGAIYRFTPRGNRIGGAGVYRTSLDKATPERIEHVNLLHARNELKTLSLWLAEETGKIVDVEQTEAIKAFTVQLRQFIKQVRSKELLG